MKTDYRRIVPIAAALAVMLAGNAMAQTSATHQHTDAAPGKESANLSEQLEALRQKVQHLEHQMQSTASGDSMSGMNMGGEGRMGMDKGMMRKGMMSGMSGTGSDASAGMNMSGQGSKGKGMGKMGTMSVKRAGMAGMSGMSGGSEPMSDMKMGGMGMMGKGMGMMGMMKGMGAMSGMSMQSALPGFPGASHLYHIGATGLFLDHGEHIQLSTEQQAKLNQVKEKASLEQATADRKIEEAEQQLWELTAADQPDAKSIEAKIHEIEKLGGDQRLAFIRAVGEAATVLTHEQHQTLTGTEPNPGVSAHTNHQP